MRSSGQPKKEHINVSLVTLKATRYWMSFKTESWSKLKDYFRSLPIYHIQMVVMDMWQPYKILAQQLFQNSIIIVDQFHYARQNFWALEPRQRSKLDEKVAVSLP
ncbi:transposase [Aeribacillus sp. FSL K6-1121]|jgi:hypothetical protein|nr:transposase [Aeribacillus pallidus]